MDFQKTENEDIGLNLSSDAKPRLKWTSELHGRFVEAVAQLGGEEKATPKSLMRVMGIPGLTLYHLKSHLQKFRLGKKQFQLETCKNDREEEINHFEMEIRSNPVHGETGKQVDESLKIAQALKVQMDVQKKLHEQLEVQKHLQLRIEAQGKYLHSILMKAQNTLSIYNSSTMNTQTSETISMTETQNQNSSISELTEIGVSLKNSTKRPIGSTDCSTGSSLTSSESSGQKDEELKVLESEETHECDRDSYLLPLMEVSSIGRKRGRRSICDETSVKQLTKRSMDAEEVKSSDKLRKFGLVKEIDLNCKYQSEMDSGLELELNHG